MNGLLLAARTAGQVLYLMAIAILECFPRLTALMEVHL